MKNKLALICLVSAAAFAFSACQNKSGTEDVKQSGEPETQSVAQTETDENTGSKLDNMERISDREDYVGFQDLNIDDFVTLNDYKNMKVTVPIAATDDASIEEYINGSLLTGYITDRAVEMGDVVKIDYEGKEDGVAFAGGTAQGQELEIGSGSFIAGFEDGLIGVMPGETATLNLKFPDDYHSAEHAGKEVVFTVKVNSIVYSAKYADVTKEDMARLGLSYESKEELWDAAKMELEQIEKQTFEVSKTDVIFNQIFEESTIKSVPEYLVEEQIQSNEIYMDKMSRTYYNMSLEDYLKSSQMFLSLEEFAEDIRPDCEAAVKRYLILEALARAEKIEITDDIIRECLREYLEIEGVPYDGYTVDNYIDDVGYTICRMIAIEEKVGERLKEIIEVEQITE